MNRYVYEGPVEEFGRCITHHWAAATYAPSENKARSNFAHQYKQQFNLVSNARITLPGKITMIRSRGERTQ